MTALIKRLTLFSLLCLFLASCTSRGFVTLDENANQAALPDATKVAVYSTDDAGKPYTTLGAVIVSADAGSNAKPAVDKLKEEAAKLGADAIVNLKLRYSTGFWGLSLEASGMAVKLND